MCKIFLCQPGDNSHIHTFGTYTLIVNASIVLHIGLPKTGSSSLQSAFSILSNQLATKRIYYPVVFKEGFNWKAERGLGAGNANIHEPYSWSTDNHVERLSELIDKTIVTTDGVTLLSSELLNSLACIESFWQMLQAKESTHRAKIKVVGYVRNPFDMFVGCYQQSIKLGGFRGSLDDSVDEFLEGTGPMTFRFLKEITHFFEYSSKYQIEVELFHYDNLGEDITQHFFNKILNTDISNFEFIPRRVNRSLQPVEVEFHRGVNSVSQKLGQLLGFDKSDTLLGGLTRFNALPQLPFSLSKESEDRLSASFSKLRSDLNHSMNFGFQINYSINRINLPFSLSKEQEELKTQIFELGKFVATSFESGYINWDFKNSINLK